MARKASDRVDFTGPMFNGDASKTLRENIRTMLLALAEAGERDVKGQIASRAGAMPHYTGRTRDSIVGRVESLTGKTWALNAVVSPSTKGASRAEAISTMAAASLIEGRWHPIRRTASAMNRARAILLANLTEGLEE